MQKWIWIMVIVLAGRLAAQNFQLHYDMGKDRKYFTSTFEMFKADEYGSTFYFIDFDFDNAGNRSASLAYFEIARYFHLKFTGIKGLSATLQYNDGTAPWGPLGHIWLVGFSYQMPIAKFINLSTDLLFRKDYLSDGSDFQATFVWFKNIMHNKLTFTGFLDIWSARYATFQSRKIVILTEPQIWYRIQKHLELGGEVEISKNFLPSDQWKWMPTIGFKWTF